MKTAMPTSRARTAYGLLSDVRLLILAEPKRYNQTIVRYRGKAGTRSLDAPLGVPSCGTVGCVMGWVETLRVGTARDTLGIGYLQAAELFCEDAVPYEPQTAKHAKAGAAHIRRFQKKYEVQLRATKVPS